jgi:hypothetical protein
MPAPNQVASFYEKQGQGYLLHKDYQDLLPSLSGNSVLLNPAYPCYNK